MKWEVPFYDLKIQEEEKNAALDVLNSNWITTGPKTEEFEKKFSRLYGDDFYSTAVSSATAALHLSLVALDITEGDEVILPSLTFVACANVIKYLGAKPVFADITSYDNWNICPTDVEKKITIKTKAIMLVHFAGYACEMDSFINLANRYNLKIIEDCSHALLAKCRENFVGTFGDTACFSFFSNKNITTAEGGMVISKNKKISDRIKSLRSHGITSSTYQRFQGHQKGYDVSEVGYNYRIDEIRSAIGIVQLKRLKNFNLKRKELVEYYKKLLFNIKNIHVPFRDHEYESSYHIFPILAENIHVKECIINFLFENKIQTSIHYRPVHTFSAYRDIKVNIPVTNNISDRIITLPLFPEMKRSQIDFVINNIKKCLTSLN